MYKCDKCGKVVDELPVITEKYPYGDRYANQKVTDDACECGGPCECGEACEWCDSACPCKE